MKRAALSLRVRLFLLILSPLLLVSVLLGWWRFEVAQATADRLFDRGLLAAALAISRDVANSEGDALSPRTRALISDAGGGEVFYHVTGPGGTYVTGYAYPPVVTEMVGLGPNYTMATYRDDKVRVLRMSEHTNFGTLSGETVVTVWQRASDRDAFAADLARRAAALIVGLMATLAVVVWFAVDLGLRPLRGLQEAIERRSPDDLSRIQRAVPHEVTGIVATLNRLFGQVDDSIQAHQRFISDAAHQLRNPASALLSLAETLPEARDAEARHAHERALIRAARGSAQLAEQLLSLERLQHSGLSHQTQFDLGDTVQSVCEAMAPDVLGRDIGFSLDPADPPLMVLGDETLVGEAIRNLIDNAMQHGGPQLTKIEIRTRREGDVVMVSVMDDGQGLPVAASDVVFRRFGQLRPGEGSGLGLSIVQEVAQRHGGTVRVRPADHGAHLEICLPLVTAQAPVDSSTSQM